MISVICGNIKSASKAFSPAHLYRSDPPEPFLGFVSGGLEGHARIAKVFPLSDAADAVRHLIEERPFGSVLMRVEDRGQAAQTFLARVRPMLRR